MCLDTGHLAYAGIDPAAAIRQFGSRIDHVHLKDVDPEVLRKARESQWDFWRAISAGVFCPIGRGFVDFAAVLDELRRIGFAGSATIEQDRHPASRTDPLADLRTSIEYLQPLMHDEGGA